MHLLVSCIEVVTNYELRSEHQALEPLPGFVRAWRSQFRAPRTHAWRARVVGLFREWRVRVMCAYARVGLCGRHNVGAAQAQLSGKCMEVGTSQSTRTHAWRARGWSKMLEVRVRAMYAYAWMVLCFQKNFFYVFAPIQAFQTSKQLPKHHKTLFSMLKLPNILN